MSQFWHVDLGNVLTAASLMLGFWTAHRAIVSRIQKSADRMARIEERLNTVYDWFVSTWGGGCGYRQNDKETGRGGAAE